MRVGCWLDVSEEKPSRTVGSVGKTLNPPTLEPPQQAARGMISPSVTDGKQGELPSGYVNVAIDNDHL